MLWWQSPYCGGASFSSSSEWWTGTHSVKLCKFVDNPVMAQQTTKISQLQSIDEVFDVLLVQVQQILGCRP